MACWRMSNFIGCATTFPFKANISGCRLCRRLAEETTVACHGVFKNRRMPVCYQLRYECNNQEVELVGGKRHLEGLETRGERWVDSP